MPKSYQERRFGSLETLEVSGDDSHEKSAVVILCHGYGADAFDLLPLHQAIESTPGTRWVFPQAPLELMHLGGGRAWFEIDIEALNMAMRTGTFRAQSKTAPAGLAHARDEILQLQKELGVPWSQIILGGFSQGAMIATEVALHINEQPRGLAILSGTLVNEEDWVKNASRRAGLKFFQSHGKNDPLLDFKEAQRLEKLLLAGGLRGQLLPFAGGHEIPPNVIQGLSGYIRKATAPIAPT